MKRLGIILTFSLLFCAASYAQLKVVGTEENINIDTSDFPQKMQAAYILMTEKCGECHSLGRVIVAVQTGVSPISKMNFSKENAKSIVTRMYQKPKSNMTREDVKNIVEVLHFILDEKVTLADK